ncbi:MAG: protein kinase [Bryobacteraceae bacterium]
MTPERIGGYEILKELGRGAMGVVYHAHDSAIGRPVAIKVIRIDAGTSAHENAQLRQRLIREASTAGKIYHPGIVTVHQLGEDGENIFIVMEYVEGASLETLLVNNPVLGRAWTLDILRQVADALDYAHKSLVVHRDVKPGNILVRSDGRVKIADFGIAKITSSVQTGMTGVGISLGSPAYMSPEQAQATQIDGRSDQFALGTMAFQMFTGRMPFKGDSIHSVMYQIVMSDPFDGLPGDIPISPGIRAVLSRAMAKKAEDRFPNCTAFIQELTEASGISAPAAQPFVDQPFSPQVDIPRPPVPPPPPPLQSKRWMLPAIACGVLAVLLIAGGIYWYMHPAPAPGSGEQQPVQPGGGAAPPGGSTSNALRDAIASGNVDRVKAELAKVASVDTADPDGTTPLMLAVSIRPEMVEALLAAGAHVDSVDALGRSALYRGSADGKTDAIRILLDHQAKVNLRANDFSTPLMQAAANARLDAAQLLLDRGADVNLGDSNNMTPLMVAAEKAPAEIVKLLLSHGAKRGAKDSRGRIAFQIAVENKNAAAVQLLR